MLTSDLRDESVLRLMSKRKRPNVGYQRVVERAAPERIGRLKLIARKLLAELEVIDQVRSSSTIRGKIDFYEEVKRFETELIFQALTHSGGHQLRAAQMLNMNPSTLNAKIKQYNIETNAFSHSEDAPQVQPIPSKLRVIR